MAPINVILLACGSFNPPTNMHLRMFEVARDNLNRLGQYLVIGGIISPVHDSYGKKDLAPSMYRCEMVKLALKSSDWIKISYWESCQESWSKTRHVLQYHQDILNSVLNDQRNKSQNVNLRNSEYDFFSWITNDLSNIQGPVQIKLLCGADLLQSFGVPGLWAEADIETIVRKHGLIVISRQGYDPHQFIYESDILTRNQSNIVVINEWVTNDISSTKIRRALRRQESVKYLIEDSVIQFIREYGLYGCTKNNHKYFYKPNINESLSIPCIDDYILTPSPSDVNMQSVGSAGDCIFLELNQIADLKQSESVPSGMVEISSPKDKSEEESPVKPKKVGFTNSADDRMIAQRQPPLTQTASPSKEENIKIRSLEWSNISDESAISGIKTTSKASRKETKSQVATRGSKPLSKTESDGAGKYYDKSISVLRRSNSDAVMSRRSENGQAASVKIQFTKDGIKVISDKESIV